MRALFSASKGLSMPTSTAPGFICASSASSGARTFKTSCAPSASAAVPMVAPTASYAPSVWLALTPAPACTTTLWPWATYFLTVSGVAATRVSPARVSCGMPMYIVNFSFSWRLVWLGGPTSGPCAPQA
ncbi:hypothetical protein D9M72_505750 [compost metagenome]